MEKAKGGDLLKKHPTAPFTVFASVMRTGVGGGEKKMSMTIVWDVAPPPESVVNLAPD